MNSQSQLSVSDLVVERGHKEILHGVSFDFSAGEITAIVGANGAGKSSALLSIAGVLSPLKGSIQCNGDDLTGTAPDHVRRHGVALVPEGHVVLGSLTVLDNLKLAASHLPAKEVCSAVDEALAMFPELTTRLDVLARSLSGGQKQMVLLSQALIASPKFLLVDELSLGLAPTIVNRLAATLEKLAANGMGIILVEQFTTLALRLSKRAYVMERGSIVWSGESAHLRENPDILHSAYLSS